MLMTCCTVNAIALDAIGWKYYIIFIISDLGQAVIGYFIMVETKGLTLEDIEVLFGGPHASGDSGR